LFYLCKPNQKWLKKPLFSTIIEMKDRIRQIMESKHMTQQVFAQYIELSPASLSNMFNGRTNPTLNIVEAIKKKIPNINTDWLMFGSGSMYIDASTPSAAPQETVNPTENSLFDTVSPVLDFETPPAPTPQMAPQANTNYNSVKSTHQNYSREEVKIADKPQRRVVEIRVFYDDQTWESFSPSKK